MPTAALQSQIERLDRIINRRADEEEAALKRADASLEEARRQRQRANAEARRQIQATYADAFAAFGSEPPAAIDDEAPTAYRKRLFNRLARRLPTGHDLAGVRADDVASQEVVFGNFEALLLQAARQEGERPSAENLPPDGTLVSRTRVDDMNGKSINWYGTESFIKGFTRPGRQVERIVDRSTGQAIWGKPF
jgi:hypothetical protein